MLRRALIKSFCIQAVCLSSFSAPAVVPPEMHTQIPKTESGPFPVSLTVGNQVRFWVKIFSIYPSTTVVIHDADNATIVDIIDFEKWAKAKGKKIPSPEMRSKITSAYQKRYEKALDRFKKEGRSAVKYGAIEERIYSVFSQKKLALRRLYLGQATLRSQTGLRDEFHRAADRARTLLPAMERIFRQYQVPDRITRLAFVESMFNPDARSRVGASGIWQFMRGTGRQFLRINRLMDERNSPLKATRAAAKLLSGNYDALGNWPLAITAYNHGRAGIARAMKKLRTEDLTELIHAYDNASFGFASKNFYAEFLAAAQVYDDLQHSYPPVYGNQLSSLVLKERFSLNDLVRYTSLSMSIIKKYNLCLNDQAYTDYRHHKLPASFELFVPHSLATMVINELNRKSKGKQEVVTFGKFL